MFWDTIEATEARRRAAGSDVDMEEVGIMAGFGPVRPRVLLEGSDTVVQVRRRSGGGGSDASYFPRTCINY
jgi:hypothetical protein